LPDRDESSGGGGNEICYILAHDNTVKQLNNFSRSALSGKLNLRDRGASELGPLPRQNEPESWELIEPLFLMDFS
jgi:hypothetical protein